MTNQRRIDEATALHREGRLGEAAQKYEALLALNPGDANVLNLLGIVAGQQGDYTRSLMLLKRAIDSNPTAPHFRNSLAVTLERIGNREGAAAEFNEEGNLLLPLLHYNEALAAFGHALRLSPETPQYKCNYAVALIKLGRPQEAAALLAATPDENRLSYIPLNLGNALAGLPQPLEAIAAYDRALTMEPTMVEAHWARGQMLLLTGDYEQGLREYEWRKNWSHFINPYRALPELQSQEVLPGKLLIVTEQGYGDTIQFARYVPMLAAQGYKVIFEVQEPLYTLLAEGFVHDNVEIVARSAMAPRLSECAAHILLMSLPQRFATRVDSIPAEASYLTVSDTRIAEQDSRLPKCDHKRIGIVRMGQVQHGNDYIRSIPADILQPLLDADADFHSLQITTFDHEKVSELGLGFRDFADTAAAIMAMDLVITVDTSVAHLAGALGKPVWILIPHAPDWRWGLTGAETAWYPAARLFRQNDADDWPRVILEVRKMVDEFLEQTAMTKPDIATIEAAIAAEPSNPENYRALAAAHVTAGNALAGAAVYAQLADAELNEKMYEEAAGDYSTAVALDASNPHLFNNFGVALRCLKRSDEAIAAFTAALKLDPALYSALSNRANMYWDAGQREAALADHHAAIAARPDDAQVHVNYAVALRETGALPEALAAYNRAVELQPDFALAHYDRGQLLAQMGDLKEGFAEMEWRWAPAYHYKEKPRRYKQPVWRTRLPKNARGRLLIISEQGYGDTIQFSRYAPLLVARGQDVVLEVQPPLLRLYSESFTRPNLRVIARQHPAPKPRGIAGWLGSIGRGGGLPSFDAYVGMLSLPDRFATTLKTIPATTPYLSVSAAQSAKWAARIKPTQKKLKIGLAWQGDPKHPQDKTRSLAPALLQPLLETNDVQFFGLQKGKSGDFSHANLTQLGPELVDFYDTAGAIKNLDLVISIDSAVAHLAGALGKPVWIMLTKIGEWRWLTDGDKSPWYPSARLFRQDVQGDWQDAIARLVEELKKFAAT